VLAAYADGSCPIEVKEALDEGVEALERQVSETLGISTHCNTLHHSATLRNTLQHSDEGVETLKRHVSATLGIFERIFIYGAVSRDRGGLQLVFCNTCACMCAYAYMLACLDFVCCVCERERR